LRFPFTFMGVFSVAFGGWVGAYVALHPTHDPVTQALELGPGIGLVGFGAYLIYRRVAHGSAA
jgi:hypothetical protein